MRIIVDELSRGLMSMMLVSVPFFFIFLTEPGEKLTG